MTLIRNVVAIAIVCAGLGCVGPTFVVQHYGGPIRPPESLAILRVRGADNVQVLAVDDDDAAPIESDARMHVEMLPGRHAVTVRDASDPRGPELTLAFAAGAGKTYRVELAAPGAELHVVEVDRDTDAPGRDVTLRSPAPAPPR